MGNVGGSAGGAGENGAGSGPNAADNAAAGQDAPANMDVDGERCCVRRS